jgi:hypothetical protein
VRLEGAIEIPQQVQVLELDEGQKVTCILRRLQGRNDGCQCRFGSLHRELLSVHAASRPIKIT